MTVTASKYKRTDEQKPQDGQRVYWKIDLLREVRGIYQDGVWVTDRGVPYWAVAQWREAEERDNG